MLSLVPRVSLPAFNVSCKKQDIKSWEREPGDEAGKLMLVRSHEIEIKINTHRFIKYNFHSLVPNDLLTLILTWSCFFENVTIMLIFYCEKQTNKTPAKPVTRGHKIPMKMNTYT